MEYRVLEAAARCDGVRLNNFTKCELTQACRRLDLRVRGRKRDLMDALLTSFRCPNVVRDRLAYDRSVELSQETNRLRQVQAEAVFQETYQRRLTEQRLAEERRLAGLAEEEQRLIDEQTRLAAEQSLVRAEIARRNQCTLEITDYLGSNRRYGPYASVEQAFESLAPLVDLAIRDYYDAYINIDCHGTRAEIVSVITIDRRRLVTFSDWFRVTPYFTAYRRYESEGI